VVPDGPDSLIHVHVQPRAGRTEIVGRHGNALKIRVTAPPVDGRATDAAARVLAGALGVAVRDVRLESGAASRLKRFRVVGVPAAAVAERLGL
jgi:uncharacterized protein (TIGR00251 family)